MFFRCCFALLAPWACNFMSLHALLMCPVVFISCCPLLAAVSSACVLVCLFERCSQYERLLLRSLPIAVAHEVRKALINVFIKFFSGRVARSIFIKSFFLWHNHHFFIWCFLFHSIGNLGSSANGLLHPTAAANGIKEV